MKEEFLARARELTGRIRAQAGKTPLQIFIRIKKGALVRFTNNGVHQNGFQDLFHYTLSLPGAKGFSSIESNDLSPEGIQTAITQLTHSAAKSFPKSPPFQKLPRVKEWFPFDLPEIPGKAARVIRKAVELIRHDRASANGYYSAYHRFFYFANAQGLERSHAATAVRFGVTATKGEGKGYLSFYHPDGKRLDVTDIVEGALQLAARAAEREVQVKPGVYECVFSPRAFLELIEPLRRHFDAQLAKDGKSVFSGLLGKKIFSSTLTISDDVTHSGQFGLPFDAGGASKKKVVLIRRGVLSGLLGEGHSTRGMAEHPFNPENLVVEPGNLSLGDLFQRIRKGIFINKIWYHTLVRESRMEVTGLATAGSLYIEKGRIQGRVVHLRYHDSLFSILASVRGATRDPLLLKDGERGAALFPHLWVSRLKVV